MGEQLLMQLKGNNGWLLVYETYIYFERKSILGNIEASMGRTPTGSGNEKTIEYSEIEGIKWNTANLFKNGYLSVAVKNDSKNEGGVIGATKDDTSIVFYPKSNNDALKCYNFIYNKIRENGVKNVFEKEKEPSVVVNQISPADEIRKYKALLDDGIIT